MYLVNIMKLSIQLSDRVEVNRPFEGTCRVQFQGRRIRQARNQHEAASEKASENSVHFQRITRCYIPDDRTLI
jgi:hypothetical protein